MSYLTVALAEIREKYATDKTDKIDKTTSSLSFGTIGNFVTITDSENSCNWDAADRQADYDERAAMMEFDGGMTRAMAEARAQMEVDAPRRGDAQQGCILPSGCAHAREDKD